MVETRWIPCRQRIIFSFFILSLFLPQGGTALLGQVLDSYHEALSLIGRQEYGKGIKTYYKFLLKFDPLTSVASRRTDIGPVIEHCSRSGGTGRSSDETRFMKALIERILLNFPEAQSEIERLRVSHPRSPLLNFLKGEFLLAEDQVEKAVAMFGKIDHAPQTRGLVAMVDALLKRRGIDADSVARRSGLLSRAFRHIDLLERSQGERALRQVLQEFPGDIEASGALIDLLVEMTRYDEAQQALEEFKATAGPAAIPPYQEARLRFLQGRYPDVVEILSPVEETLEEISRFHYAESLFQIGRFSDSLPWFEKLRENDPDNVGFVLRAVACQEGLERYAAAAESLARESARQPAAELFRLELAGLYERMNRPEEATEAYQTVVQSGGPLADEAKGRLELLRTWKEEARKQAERDSPPPPAPPVPEDPVPNPPSAGVSALDRKNAFDRLAARQTKLAKRLKRMYD